MTLLMIIRVAFRALVRNKMRAALTMLGIIIGVSAVIAMVSIGQGASASVQAQIESIGTNLLFVSAGVSGQTYPFTLPDLPYPHDALEPSIDQKTLQLHHGAHHKAYVTKLNEALEKQPSLHGMTLVELLRDVDKLPEAVRTPVKNNGGGHLLHDFFWNVMKPGGGGEPGGELATAINGAFGSFAEFRRKFSDASARHFASGWVALAADPASQALEIVNLKEVEDQAPNLFSPARSASKGR